MVMPAERATATQWIKWLVEPPVASKATMALTMQRSSTCTPMGGHFQSAAWDAAPGATVCLPNTVRTASRVNSPRTSAPGLIKAVPGTCKPIASKSIWLLLAVP